MNILVTGGSGFIGTSLCNMLMLDERVDKVICLDKLTYASNEHYKKHNRNYFAFRNHVDFIWNTTTLTM